jgi:putative transposase
VPHLRRLKQLEAENARLKRLVAEQMLANDALKEVLEKRGWA